MTYKYYGLLLLTCLCWAGNFVVSKTLVEHASPLTLTTLRWLIAAVCLVPLVWWKEKKLVPPRNAILPLFLMGSTGVVLFNLFQFYALERTTATNVGLISTLNTITIAVCSFFFLKEKLNPLQMVAMFFSLFGVFLVLTKGRLTDILFFDFNTGDMWMVAAVCIWGIYTICSKWAMTMTSGLMAILYASIFGLMILLPLNLSNFTVTNVTPAFIGSLLYTGVISTVLCMLLWTICVQKLGATTSGVFLNFNPIFTAIMAYILLGEQMTWVQIIGSMIVIAGCFLFTYFKGKVLTKRKMATPLHAG
ncbi:DMT family transporter [Metabacillus sp. HB246100]